MQYSAMPPTNVGKQDDERLPKTSLPAVQFANNPVHALTGPKRGQTQRKPEIHTAAPAVSLERITLSLRETQQAAFVKGTCMNYYRNINSYVTFCEEYNLKAFPVSDESISLYAQSRAIKGYNPSSITNMVSSIKSVSKMIGYNIDPIGFPGLKMTLKGMERLYGKPAKQAAPITLDILVNIGLRLNFDRKFHVTMWAIFLTSFFVLLRKSHVSHSAKQDDNFLLRKHLVRTENGYEVIIEWSKTNQLHSRMEKLPLLPIAGSLLCPVAAIDEMIKSIPAGPNAPAFCTAGKRPINYNTYQKFLKEIIDKVGHNSKEFSTHSFRRGGTTFLAQCGVDPRLIQLMGDWKSDCYKKYISFPLQDRLKVSKTVTKKIKTLNI